MITILGVSVLDLIIIGGLTWFLLSQVILPTVRGAKLFPALSRKAINVADEIADLDEELAAVRLERELQERKDALTKLKENK